MLSWQHKYCEIQGLLLWSHPGLYCSCPSCWPIQREDLEEMKRHLWGWCCANGSDEDGDTSTCHHCDPSGAHVSLYICACPSCPVSPLTTSSVIYLWVCTCEGHRGWQSYHRHNLSLTHTHSLSHTHTHTLLITLRAVSTLCFNNTRCQLTERSAKLSRWNSLWCRGQATRDGNEARPRSDYSQLRDGFPRACFYLWGVKNTQAEKKKRHLLALPCSNKLLKSELVRRRWWMGLL